MAVSQRLVRLDLIRVISMLMVVLLHTILSFTFRPDFFATKLYFIFEPLVALSKTSVLLFFMLSGYLVLGKFRTPQQNFRRSLLRVGVPLLFFTCINIFLDYLSFDHKQHTDISFLSVQLHKLLQFPHSSLWFLVVLLPLYLLNPVWNYFFTKENKNKAVVMMLFTLLFAIFASIFSHLKVMPPFNSITAWMGFLFFYWYGGMAQQQWVVVKNKYLNYSLVICGFILTILGDALTVSNAITDTTSTLNNYTAQFTSVPVILMAIGIFNILISMDEQLLSKHWLVKKGWLSLLAQLSFGIYLLHTYVVAFLGYHDFVFDELKINVYLFNFLNVGIVLLTATVLAFIIKKIPGLKAVIGG
jgi:surface polysaccharide O-acyltransferase-like enzyme